MAIEEAKARFVSGVARGESRHTYPLPTQPVLGAPDDLHAAGGKASLYLHIPYCTARCTYCFFTTQIGHGTEDMAQYVSELKEEMAIADRSLLNYRFTSLYYGGGTPGLLPAALFSRMHDLVQPLLDSEVTITVETHPHAADAGRIEAWRAGGVDRVSMGVQTLDPQLLKLIRREQTIPHILPALDRLLGAGFLDVNVDLLYGLPGQSLASWESTLETVIQTGVPGISIYRTAFTGATLAEFRALGASLPSPDDAMAMYEMAFERLNAAGYAQPRYGASCFSKLPYERGLNEHRNHILHGEPMVALGMGAYGSVRGYTYANHRERAPYQRALETNRLPVLAAQPVPESERPYKYAVESWKQGFLSDHIYAELFDEVLEERFADELDALQALDEIERVGDEVRLTRRGARHVAAIADMFTSPTVRAKAQEAS